MPTWRLSEYGALSREFTNEQTNLLVAFDLKRYERRECQYDCQRRNGGDGRGNHPLLRW